MIYWTKKNWRLIISQVSPESDPQSYTTFLRIMSGICEAYAMFIFPPEVPVKYYVQAVPEICLGINNFK